MTQSGHQRLPVRSIFRLLKALLHECAKLGAGEMLLIPRETSKA